jgi:hypothetical protein
MSAVKQECFNATVPEALSIFQQEMPGRAISVVDGYNMAVGNSDPFMRDFFLEMNLRPNYGGLDRARALLIEHNQNKLTAKRLAFETSVGLRSSEEIREGGSENEPPTLSTGMDISGRIVPIHYFGLQRQKLLESRFKEGLETILFSLLLPDPDSMRQSTLQNDHVLAAQIEYMQSSLKTIGSNSPELMERVAVDSYDYTHALISSSSKSPQARRESLKTLAKRYPSNGYLSLGLQKAAIDISGGQEGHSTISAGGDAHDAFVHGGTTALDFVISYIEEISRL